MVLGEMVLGYDDDVFIQNLGCPAKVDSDALFVSPALPGRPAASRDQP